jgi:hypothetical protein
MCNSRSLEEEAEYILQFEPEEAYENESIQEDTDMFMIDNIQNCEYSQGLYNTLKCSNCYHQLYPVDGRFCLFQCSGCNILNSKFPNLMEFGSE